MKQLLLFACLFVLSACATGPQSTGNNPVTVALAKARAENKLLFIMESRDGCGNCRNLRDMIKSGQLSLPADQFIFADVDCDDEATAALFTKHFNVEGSILPFVAIAAPNGRTLARHSNGGSLEDYKAFVANALKKYKN